MCWVKPGGKSNRAGGTLASRRVAGGRIRTPPPRRRHDVAKLLECASPLALWLRREERKDGLLCVDRKAAKTCRTPKR